MQIPEDNYGANSREIRTFKITRLSEGLRVVVEFVDIKEKLGVDFVSIEESIQAGMVTLGRPPSVFIGE